MRIKESSEFDDREFHCCVPEGHKLTTTGSTQVTLDWSLTLRQVRYLDLRYIISELDLVIYFSHEFFRLLGYYAA